MELPVALESDIGIYGDGDGSAILGVIEWFFDPQMGMAQPWPHPARGWDTTIVMLYISVLVKCLLKPRKILSQKNASA